MMNVKYMSSMEKLYSMLLVLALTIAVCTHRTTAELPWLILADSTEIRRIQVDTGMVQQMIGRLFAPRSLDYDYTHKTIFWSDVGYEAVYRAHLFDNGTVGRQEKLLDTAVPDVEGIAVDWIYGNIYWTDTHFDRVEVAKHDGTMRKTIVDTDLDYPLAIAVDPSNGLLFYSDVGRIPKIEKISMDGDPSTRIILVDTDISKPTGLTIDYTDQRIFWIDEGMHQISSVNYDGTRKRMLLRQPSKMKGSRAISVFEDKLYWIDYFVGTLNTVDKDTGANYGQMVGPHFVKDLKVYHENVQTVAENFCGHINGLCSHLCLPRPTHTCNHRGNKYTCACPDTLDLGADGYNCTDLGTLSSVEQMSARDIVENFTMAATEADTRCQSWNQLILPSAVLIAILLCSEFMDLILLMVNTRENAREGE